VDEQPEGEMHIASGQHHGRNDEQHYLFPVQQVILSVAILATVSTALARTPGH
jgi:hypothetical protein